MVAYSHEDVPVTAGPHYGNWPCVIRLGTCLFLAVSGVKGAQEPLPSQVTRHHNHLSPIDATTLVEQRVVKIGTIQSNKVSVAFENLAEQESLAYLGNSAPVGLVVSIFVESEQEDEPHLTEGALARAICDRVKKASPTAYEKLHKWINQLGTKKPGDVVGLNLDLALSERAKFPIDRIIVVVFEEGNSDEAAFLGQSIANVFEDAKREHLAALVVPCIGYRWDEKHSLEFGDVFKPVFKALDRPGQQLQVFISLYDTWPSMVIEDAARALNQASGVATPEDWKPSH